MSKLDEKSEKNLEYWRAEVEKIKEDSTHGSLYLGDEALNISEKFIKKQLYNNRTELFQSFSKLVNALVRSKSLIAIIYTRTHRILNFIEALPKEQRNIVNIKNLVLEEVKKIRKESEEKQKAITRFGARLILDQHTVLTHSTSKFVEDILLKAKKQHKHFRLICTESRPLMEGRQLAVRMAKAGIKTKLIPDGDIARAMKQTHFVLTGADRVTEVSFINKTGTYNLAVMAKELNMPFYIALSTDIILPKRTYPARFSSQHEEQIFENKQSNLTVENYHLEEIPISYVHKIICESGVFEVKEFEERFLSF